jgi:hypothetical protein
MGLSDKYRVALASITEFGFDCDLPLLRKLGQDVWPGVAPAQAEFKERAQREETSLDLLRHSLRERYLAEIEMERQLHQSSPTAEADQASSESTTQRGVCLSVDRLPAPGGRLAGRRQALPLQSSRTNCRVKFVELLYVP